MEHSIDREKVIKGLKYCTHTDGIECPNCPYWPDDDCVEALNADVLDLLKEQETSNLYKCPNCGTWVSAENVVRCKDCKHYDGFSQSCAEFDGIFLPDWYCADGERV